MGQIIFVLKKVVLSHCASLCFRFKATIDRARADHGDGVNHCFNYVLGHGEDNSFW